MVDIVDSKSTALKACGFESHLPYHKLLEISRYFAILRDGSFWKLLIEIGLDGVLFFYA